MSKGNTTASWIGKAAYEIMQSKGLNGRDANAEARSLAESLLDFGIDLSHIDAREYARTGNFGHLLGGAPLQPWRSPGASARQNRQSAFLS